jgi:hypothetical protein
MAGVFVDALLTGNASFAVAEQAMPSRFESTTNLAIPEQHYRDFGAVRTYRGGISWLATVTRPDNSAVVAQLSQVTAAASPEALKKCLRGLKDTVSFLHDTADVVLVFPKLSSSLRLVCYADASFAGNVDHSSQLGCLLMLLDSENNTHILIWFSRKSACVTVSILTAEMLAVTADVVAAYAMLLQLAQMGIDVESDVLTDSKQGHGNVTKQRLMTDVTALRQVLRKKEVTRVGFVRSQYSLADGLTKSLSLS